MSNLLSSSDAASDEFAVVGGGGGDGASGLYAAPTFQGYLQKKSPRGFLGKHLWQRRFFLLEQAALSYWKDKALWARGDPPIGVIRADMIRDVQVPVDSGYYGLRFDVLAVGGHRFELMAPSEKSCTQWVRALRDELRARESAVTETLRNVKDEHVASHYWKKHSSKDVKDMHAHAERAVPVAKGSHSRQGSSSGFGAEEDEEARERAEALAAMMADEQAKKHRSAAAAAASSSAASADDTGSSGGIASVFQRKKPAPAPASPALSSKDASAPPSAGHTPSLSPGTSPADPPTLSPEERAQTFLKQQYSTTANKVTNSRRGARAAQQQDVDSANSTSDRPRLKTRTSSSAGFAGDDAPPPAAAAAAVPAASRRRPTMSSFADSDSDSETEKARRAAMLANIRSGQSNGALAAASAAMNDEDEEAVGHVEVRMEGDDAAAAAASSSASVAAASPSSAAAASPSPSLSPYSSSAGAPARKASSAATSAASAEPAPLISSVLWKESPSGLFKVWQKRFFALQPNGALVYFRGDALLSPREREANLAGTIPVHQISKVALALSQDKGGKGVNTGTDFNLFTTEGRIYKLRSESPELTRQWIAHIQACDPRRLGTTYPGLVERDDASSGSSPAGPRGQAGPAGAASPRGRLNSTPNGRVVVSVLPVAPAGDSMASPTPSNVNRASGIAVAAPLPLTRDEAAAEESVEERRSFMNFLKNKHSLLSILFVHNKARFPRSARLFLFTLDLLMNLFFVYVFIVSYPELSLVKQVVAIVFILLAIEMVLAFALREWAFQRSLGPIEQQVRLAICAVALYALFIGLTAWQWTLLPGSSAVMALVRFICSSIGVILVEILAWYALYSCATGCCPCLTLDDGTRSLEDIKAEADEVARKERSKKHQEAVEQKRAKLHKKMDVKRAYREEDEV